MHELNAMINFGADQVTAAAGHPWIYLLVALFCFLDGFFPPVPSETIVLAMAALAVGHGGWTLIPLFFVAAGGAVLGDLVAFAIGRRSRLLGTKRQGGRISKALDKFGSRLERQGTTMILTARFIPVGRVAVNVAAGASGFSAKKFAATAGLASLLWSGYTVGIGALAGNWFRENPLLGIVAAIVVAAGLGLAFDALAKHRHKKFQLQEEQLAGLLEAEALVAVPSA